MELTVFLGQALMVVAVTGLMVAAVIKMIKDWDNDE